MQLAPWLPLSLDLLWKESAELGLTMQCFGDIKIHQLRKESFFSLLFGSLPNRYTAYIKFQSLVPLIFCCPLPLAFPWAAFHSIDYDLWLNYETGRICRTGQNKWVLLILPLQGQISKTLGCEMSRANFIKVSVCRTWVRKNYINNKERIPWVVFLFHLSQPSSLQHFAEIQLSPQKAGHLWPPALIWKHSTAQRFLAL